MSVQAVLERTKQLTYLLENETINDDSKLIEASLAFLENQKLVKLDSEKQEITQGEGLTPCTNMLVRMAQVYVDTYLMGALAVKSICEQNAALPLRNLVKELHIAIKNLS